MPLNHTTCVTLSKGVYGERKFKVILDPFFASIICFVSKMFKKTTVAY